MRNPRSPLLPLFLLLLAASVTALAAVGSALAPLTQAVTARRDAIGKPSGDAQRRRFRALGRIERELAGPGTTLTAQMRAAARAGRILERRFGRDAELPALLDAAVSDLAASAHAERDRLGLWTSRVGDAPGDERLRLGLRRIDRRFELAASRTRDSARARFYGRGCAEIDRTRGDLGLAGDPPPLPADAMPDFSLADVNPNSATYGAKTSPRNHRGKISAWYFGHAG